jgi:hypothetical protein
VFLNVPTKKKENQHTFHQNSFAASRKLFVGKKADGAGVGGPKLGRSTNLIHIKKSSQRLGHKVEIKTFLTLKRKSVAVSPFKKPAQDDFSERKDGYLILNDELVSEESLGSFKKLER